MEGYVIELLPNEIIEKIIGCNVLSHYDVINFGLTCSKFRSLVNNSNRVWKCKFNKRWPQLLKLYNPKQVYNWLAEFQLRVNKGALVRQYVASMSSKMYHLEEIQDSSLADMEAMMNDHERSYHFIMDELINKGNPLRNSDLTEVYYAEKLVCCLKKQQLKKFWNNFKQIPPEEQLLEKGAVFVAKWIQSSMAISPALVSRQLDLLAGAVREVLRSRHPFHSIFSTSLDLVEQWKQKALTDNQFGPTECQQVLVALGEVIFNHNGFYTDNNMHYNVDNACINMVLDRCQGSPIIICIIYESVARRLGVKCDTLSLPEHFLLRWKESYTCEKSSLDSVPYFYIDVFNQGKFLNLRSCPRFSTGSQCPMQKKSKPAATTLEVVERLANNLEVACRQRTLNRNARLRNALELIHLVNPRDIHCLLKLARLYMLSNMDIKDLMICLTSLYNELSLDDRNRLRPNMQVFHTYTDSRANEDNSPPPIIPNPHIDGVDYAVGMIMRHQHLNYTCVIYGWDPLCSASDQWMLQMGVDQLALKGNQPFYNVLVADGTSRYAAQENLEVHRSPTFVNHPQIGRYFERFCSTHFLPNLEKKKEYPDDANIVLRYLAPVEP